MLENNDKQPAAKEDEKRSFHRINGSDHHAYAASDDENV